MRGSTGWALAFLVSLGLPRAALGQAQPDSVAVAQTVADYIRGWRNGDVELLAKVFDPEGVVLWQSADSGSKTLGKMTFEEILNRGPRPNTGYGEPFELLSLDVVDGSLAVAKVTLARTGGSYVDYLVLYKLSLGWRIVTKTFVVRAS